MTTCPLTGHECDCPILCDVRPWPGIQGQLAAFNDTRRALLGSRPIDPEGEIVLMSDEERGRLEQ